MTATTTKPDRAAINRRNAQKSTGPRTPEGKNRSRFNAVKHGMTAKILVLPGEDANVLQFRVETWTADLLPQNDLEQFLVEQAVHASWRIERAERAEAARLSHIIESMPAEEAIRQREEAAALGRRLFSDRDVNRDANLNRDLLKALFPRRKAPSGSQPLDVLDHPEAIVRRLEASPAGCQWLLDRWIELHDILNQVGAWEKAEKVQAIRMLGKPPLDLTPPEWENHCARRRDDPCPELDAYIDRQLDRQLDARLDGSESATLATLRSVTEGAIARLETLVAAHHQRAEAEAARQADILSFDTSTEGERLRRYQFSCSRTLFRSLDTLMKVRRSGLAAARDEQGELPVVSLESPEGPVASSESELGSATAATEEPTETATEPGILFRAPSSVNPPADDGNRQDQPQAPRVAESPRPRLPFHRTVLGALTLVVLLGAAVGSHRNSQNEPTDRPVNRRNPRNEAISAPGQMLEGSPTASALTLDIRREGGLLVSLGHAPMTHTASPSAVSRLLIEPSVSNATLCRYQEIDSIESATRPPVESPHGARFLGNPRRPVPDSR